MCCEMRVAGGPFLACLEHGTFGLGASFLGAGQVLMDRFTARRKLLRGSLSAPLVLTVASSPAAAAARGSWEACLLRAGQDPEVADAWIPANAHDTWLRLSVPVYRGTVNSNSDELTAVGGVDEQGATVAPGQAVSTDLASGAEESIQTEPAVAQTVSEQDFYLLEERYYPYDPNDSAVCSNPVGYAMNEVDIVSGDGGQKIQLLVFVDDTGQVVAAGPCASLDSQPFPVSGSCWASFGGMQV